MCLFCDWVSQPTRFLWENELAFAVWDGFPVTQGHTLILPKRHIETLFEATDAELLALGEGIRAMKTQLDALYHPAGYNVGNNNGAAAGQTIMHLHVHLIPRYLGDVPLPRGGIRNILPGKIPY
jgi:diadenosine tetraphosphate (Ap4A) HIT family hydrolase